MPKPINILVIDDDRDIHDFMKLVLEPAGYTVFSAFSMTEGQELMKSSQPDLVILDVIMEEVDAGFKMATWLGTNHPGVPVLMLSSIVDEAHSLFDTSSLTVAELVNKPIAHQDLLSTVARLLSRRN